MTAPRKYPQELRERAMRLVQEAQKEGQALSLNAAVIRIGTRTGVDPDTLRGWCKQASIDAGELPGTTSADAARINPGRFTTPLRLPSKRHYRAFLNPGRNSRAREFRNKVRLDSYHLVLFSALLMRRLPCGAQ